MEVRPHIRAASALLKRGNGIRKIVSACRYFPGMKPFAAYSRPWAEGESK